jgi:hypothetical protein
MYFTVHRPLFNSGAGIILMPAARSYDTRYYTRYGSICIMQYYIVGHHKVIKTTLPITVFNIANYDDI